MKLTIKKSLFTAIIVAVLAFACSFLTLGMSGAKTTALAEETLARPDSAITVGDVEFFKENSFYVYDGAAVRVTNSGLKFVTYVDPAFHAELTKDGATVTYFATAKKVGGTNELANKIPFYAETVENGMYELRTYINFGNVEKDSPDQAAQYYANNYTTSTFAKVVSSDGATTTYYQATDGVVRSMRAVGNASVLGFVDSNSDGLDDKYGYTLSDVEKYITVGERTETTKAYVFADDGSDYVSFAGLDGTKNTSIDVYVGAKNVGKFNYSADNNVYVGALIDAKNADYISTFVDGKVYSVKAGDAIRIEDAEGMKQLQNNTTSNIYVIDKDIDMSTITEWTVQGNSTYSFKGVLDGLQNSIYNYTVRSSGLFGFISQAQIKNLHVEVENFASGSRYAGVLTSRSHASTFENIYIDILADTTTGTGSCSGIFGVAVSGGISHINNCVVVYESKVTAPRAYGVGATAGDGDAFFVTRAEGQVKYTNVYGLNGTNYKLPVCGWRNDGGKLVMGTSFVDDGTLYDATVSGIFDFDSTKLSNDFLLSSYTTTKANFPVIELTQANFEEKFEGATSGYYLLSENIDMKEMSWSPTGEKFSGVLDGNGKNITNFTAPSGHAGLLPYINGGGAVVRNINIQIVTNTGCGSLTGQIINEGQFFVDNCVIDLETLYDAVSSGVISNVIQGKVEVNNTFINVDDSGTRGGLIAGGEASSFNVTVSNCYFTSPKITNLFSGDNEDEENLKETTIGRGGELAKEGTDYELYTSLDDLVAGKIPKEFTDRAHKLGMVTAISKANFSDIKLARSGYYYLTEDIDFDGASWGNYTANDTFSGVFNGNNKTISNFSTGSSGQMGALFYKLYNATVKNIAFTNATVTPGIQGIICRRIEGTSTVENVFAHVKSGHSNAGAFFGTLEGSNENVVVKNSAVVVDSGCASFLNGQFGHDVTVSNCYFLGREGLAINYPGELSGSVLGTLNTDYFVYSDKNTLIKDVADGKAKMTDFVKKAFLDSNNVLVLTQDNIATIQPKLHTKTDGIIILGSDIDMTGIVWTAATSEYKKSFAGTFDGNDHTISNFSTASTNQAGGLLYTITGRVQNLSIVNATVNGSINGILARGMNSGATIENVYIHVKSVAYNSGAIAGVIDIGGVVLKDVTIVIDQFTKSTKNNVICGEYGGKATFTNTYVCAPEGVEIFTGGMYAGKEGYGVIVGTLGADYFMYTNVSDLLAVANGETNTMTDFVKNALVANKGTN